MSKKAIFIFVAAIIFISFIAYASFQYNQKLKLISEQAHKKIDQNMQVDKKENRDFYTKLANERKIHFMVIGDQGVVGAGESVEEGEAWQQQVSNLIEENYNNQVYQHQVIKDEADMFDNMLMYEQGKKETQQDLVAIAFGESDVNRLTVEQFEKSYETLLNQVIADQPGAEIFAIIGRSLSEEEEYARAIVEISDHYGVASIDVEEVLENADESMEELTTEEGKLNKAGVSMYAESVVDGIVGNVAEKKVIDYTNIEARGDLYQVDAFQSIVEPEDLDGFKLVGESYASSTSNHSIRYEFTGELLALNLENAGGLIEVYLDGEYFKQYDLNELPQGEIHLLITDELDEEDHTIQIFVRETGKTIQLKSLITQ
ncbi:SGNH/GDSL hydrolase family protein [Paraliobacillus salinarum]|uniref:SGNH/GDSL hydrolase family protein n=1 Tax=Paraliobacillus salinarum TaxID=1158996 RepID=UPI0015F734EB|nr:SGNH/GDSL hydrolase family protein [Paraliobacillus salinarum]